MQPATIRLFLAHGELQKEKDNYEKLEDRKIEKIRRMADRISSLIVSTDYPMIDIEIEKQKLQDLISELFPDKTGLYDLIYEPRFKRLNEQFRNDY